MSCELRKTTPAGPQKRTPSSRGAQLREVLTNQGSEFKRVEAHMPNTCKRADARKEAKFNMRRRNMSFQGEGLGHRHRWRLILRCASQLEQPAGHAPSPIRGARRRGHRLGVLAGTRCAHECSHAQPLGELVLHQGLPCRRRRCLGFSWSAVRCHHHPLEMPRWRRIPLCAVPVRWVELALRD